MEMAQENGIVVERHWPENASFNYSLYQAVWTKEPEAAGIQRCYIPIMHYSAKTRRLHQYKDLVFLVHELQLWI